MTTQFIWYDHRGAIGGEIVRPGGYDSTFDLAGPVNRDPAHPDAKVMADSHRESFPNLAGWIPVLEGELDAHLNGSYVDLTGDPVLKPRASVKLFWDDEEVAQHSEDSPLMQLPLGKHHLRVEADVPDGLSVVLGGRGVVLSPNLPIKLVFANGRTQDVTLTVPQHGMKGGVSFYDMRWLPTTKLWLMGWA